MCRQRNTGNSHMFARGLNQIFMQFIIIYIKRYIMHQIHNTSDCGTRIANLCHCNMYICCIDSVTLYHVQMITRQIKIFIWGQYWQIHCSNSERFNTTKVWTIFTYMNFIKSQIVGRLTLLEKKVLSKFSFSCVNYWC